MIYLDNNATTALDPLVFEEMARLLSEGVGNPSSIHRFGQKARARLQEATRSIAQFFDVHPEEVLYTSGATEALNLLIHSLPFGAHLITSTLEHLAVLEPVKRSGYTTSYLDPYPGKGALHLNQIQEHVEALRRSSHQVPLVLILAAANNETGVSIDLEAIANFAEKHTVTFLVDGVAYLGKTPLSTLPQGVTAFVCSGHKIHGPLGIGCALVRRRFKVKPLMYGGGQQRGLRAGTENLPAIVGFEKALKQITQGAAHFIPVMAALREQLEQTLLCALKDVVIIGSEEKRVCNTSQIAFPGVDGETLLMRLDLAGLAASYGSACSSGSSELSRVLLSMGITPKLARSALRFSLSRFTTEEEITRAAALIIRSVNLLRMHSRVDSTI